MQRHQQGLLLCMAGGVVALVGLLPVARLLLDVPSAIPTATEVLGHGRPWYLLARSVALSAAVTTAALALGVPLGALAARTDLIARRALWTVHALPMFLPPFVLALGWFHLLHHASAAGSGIGTHLLFSEVGFVLVLLLAFVPVVTSLVAFGILGVDASLEDAARVVAGPRQVAIRILVPAARPAIALSALVVFALAFSELGVPMFLRIDVYPAVVFSRLGGIDFAPGEAVALVLPLVPVALGLLWFARRFAGPHALAVQGLRGSPRALLPLGTWRVPISAGCWLLTALAVAPVAGLLIRASGGGGFSRLTAWLGQAPMTSVSTAVGAAVVIASLGTVIGHAVARRVPGAAALDTAAVLVFLMPATVLGVGLIEVWNRPETSFVYEGIGILVVGYVARYTVIGVRCVSSAVLQSPVHLEEAAAVAGAGVWRRLWRIVVPFNARGVAFAFLMALVFCLRDLETPVLFYPAGHEPLTVRLFTLEANGPPAVIAALALIQVALTVIALSAGYLLFPRRRVA